MKARTKLITGWLCLLPAIALGLHGLFNMIIALATVLALAPVTTAIVLLAELACLALTIVGLDILLFREVDR